MDESNLIKFPGKSISKEQSKQIDEQKAQQYTSTLLNLIHKNRKEGLERAENALQSQPKGAVSDAQVEERLRGLETAVRGLVTSLEATNSLIEIVAHDVIEVLNQMNTFSTASMLQGMHIQAVLDTLLKKGIIVETELKEAWDSIKKEAIESQRSAQHTHPLDTEVP